MPTSLTELFFARLPFVSAPLRCARDEGARGVCGADNTLKVARAALHMWEEPPISGEAGSGTIFFSGCSLKCIYCQNHEISTGNFGSLRFCPSCFGRRIMLELAGPRAPNKHQPGDGDALCAPVACRDCRGTDARVGHPNCLQHEWLRARECRGGAGRPCRRVAYGL